jgi:hypothetical protein
MASETFKTIDWESQLYVLNNEDFVLTDKVSPLWEEPSRKARAKEMERVNGIEPSWPAWKAGALPLSYTRVCSIHYLFNSTAVKLGLIEIRKTSCGTSFF